jgi:cytochrome c oxidase subunit II
MVRALILLALVACLAGCSAETPSILRAAGQSAKEIRTLTIEIFAILSGILITVWSLLAWVIIRYRKRPESEASRDTGNTTLEVLWTAIPAVIVAVLFTLTLQTTGRLIIPANTVELTVTGHQWWWQVQYTGATFQTANEIHVPAERTITMDLLSADVIHGFWVPQLNGKLQLIPGHVNHITFLPLQTGTYLGECANFCGMGHAHMRFLVIVQPAAQFSAWFANEMKPASAPEGPQATAGLNAMATLPCSGCHTIRGTTLTGRLGPDLTHLASRSSIAAVTLTNTPANLRKWIFNPQAVKPGALMPTVVVPPQTLDQIVAYLEGLK